MIQDLVFFGAGGYGSIAMEVAEDINADHQQWNILGFLDDDSSKHGSQFCDYPVLGGQEWLRRNRAEVVICIGSPALRRKISMEIYSQYRSRFPTLLHPSSIVSRRATIGPGSVVYPGAVVSANTHIGNQVLVGRNSSIGHDITIGDYVNIFPSATISGCSMIGEGTEIGSNSTIIPSANIGCWSVLGAGSVVNRDLPNNVTAVGMPAIIVKQYDEGWQNLR